MSVVMKLAAATVAALLSIGFRAAASGAETKYQVALPGCREICGNITVPYPFGVGDKCSWSENFNVTCDEHSKLYLGIGDAFNEIAEIHHLKGMMESNTPIFTVCYNESREEVNKDANISTGLVEVSDSFWISREENMFYTVGCNVYGIFAGYKGAGTSLTGCGGVCDWPLEKKDVRECSGSGCCEADIHAAHELTSFGITIANVLVEVDKELWEFSKCSHAFVAKKGWYHFRKEDLAYLGFRTVPLVINWAVGGENATCKTAAEEHGYVCRGLNTDCEDLPYRYGYRCKCKPGYDGNPYLPTGCVHNINECITDNPCVPEAICVDTNGSYTCQCPKGHEGNGEKNGTRCSCRNGYESHVKKNGESHCIRKPSSGNTELIIGLTLLVVSFFIYRGSRKRRLIRLREQFFHQNGGILLQQQIAGKGGPSDASMKIFTLEDMEKATNNFDEKTILGQGGYGTVYKGVLDDRGAIAIKRSKICEKSQVEQFINEIVVLSQINHRNVVKLFGCCLETEVPLLVYEFITNGTLYEHLHTHAQSSNLSWAARLRVASESAGALSYLHSAASPPIIHRDVKTANILLDDRLTAKVGDFGASRLVPLERTQVTTLVQGTFGYLDPEYFHTGQLTDKSDVYSFGVVLAELLTGEKAISPTRAEDDRNLGAYFVSSLNNGRLSQIVDNRIVNDVNFEQCMGVAKIASRCLKVRRDDRPTMKEVAMEIEGLIVLERHHGEESREKEISSIETEYLSPSASSHAINNVRDLFTSGGKTSDGDSMELFSRSLSGGR
ncbi:unnamed protein product [Cuscuta europaea]|uniref:Uncharacterized protein n=1 Tax=Cuscuta europaea TaxID=41803 RepID=A0A9P0YX50_CUSEU|nr:unnamed protein product [Cuscuta europaea]